MKREKIGKTKTLRHVLWLHRGKGQVTFFCIAKTTIKKHHYRKSNKLCGSLYFMPPRAYGKYNHECVKSRTRPVVTGRSLIRSLWWPISWQALENKGRLWKTSQVYRATHVGGTMRGNHAFVPLPLLLLHVRMFWLSAYFLFRTSSNLSLKGQCHKSLLERGIIFMPRINVF